MPNQTASWESESGLETVKLRARMLKAIRAFFDSRDVLEIETPLMSRYCVSDPHMSSFRIEHLGENYFLNTSPEYAMKRFLAQFRVPVYQIGKAFRVDEVGPYHNPEFTMLEWYRPGYSLSQLMDEMADLLNELIEGDCTITRYTYRSIFERYADLDPHAVSARSCKECAINNDIDVPDGLEEDVDEWLDWLMTQIVLPQLPSDQFTFVTEYPSSQAALAKRSMDANGVEVAARFELFFGDIELANGFDELTDAEEQELRFRSDNKKRRASNMPVYDLDSRLLDALSAGMPATSGVAVGLDRLLMVLSGLDRLPSTLLYPWQRC